MICYRPKIKSTKNGFIKKNDQMGHMLAQE